MLGRPTTTGYDRGPPFASERSALAARGAEQVDAHAPLDSYDWVAGRRHLMYYIYVINYNHI